MAKSEAVPNKGKVITLSKQEALDLVTVLTAQLAQLSLRGREGEAATIAINNFGVLDERLIFCIDHERR